MNDRHRRSRGQAMVEFALVFPLFLVLLFGFIDVGRLVYVNNAVAQAAREGARWASVAGRVQAATYPANIVTQTKNGMAAVPTPTVTVKCFLPTDLSLGTEAAVCVSGDILQIKVTSKVDQLTPVIGQLIGSITVQATSQVVVN